MAPPGYLDWYISKLYIDSIYRTLLNPKYVSEATLTTFRLAEAY